ncbi:MAG: pyruvate dehydrogenase (acetyl-transferring) E1 component subunit alpha [Planctomycetes bacterium]|nr:pyruvate dehydrogenase (acetyl-transferring) E1 component subunit alpha [Planctomycetota bacterium]
MEKIEILSHDGKLDTKLEPKLPDADLRKLFRYMLFTRMLDERCLHLQRQGRIGTYGPCKGQEATPLGVAYHLRKEDWFVPSYRELSGFLWRGWPVDRYMLWWGGHEIGSSIPPEVNDTPICVPIASQVQYAAGIAWGAKLRKDGTVVACFCGDGGTSEGDFHEGMNYATVFKVPLVMIVQNNQWAISVPRHKQTASQTIAQKAVAYGIDAMIVDGNDILAVLVAAKEAIDKARNGGGPTLIEAITYRLSMHTTADDPKKYRSEAEVKSWEAKDPLPRFRDYLRKKKLLDEKIEAVMEEDIRNELDTAVAKYEQYRHDPYAMFDYMYAQMTPELARQKQELKAALGGDVAPQRETARTHG